MKKLAATVLAPVLALLLGAPAAASETAGQARRVDLNTATTEQLEETLGVSPEDAARIVAARPYASREDLRTKDVLPAETFDKLKKLIDSIC